MARPEIQGLKYFPFDVGFYRDKKIRLLRADHDARGVEVYQRLLCKIYEDNGYYLNWNDSEDYALMADDTGYSEEKIRMIVSTCLNRSLFDDTLFKLGNVLTSRSIQRRYFSAVRESKAKAAAQGRYTFIREDMCLLTESDFSELNKTYAWLKVDNDDSKSPINPDKSRINSSKSPINPAKERKGNEMKGKENKAGGEFHENVFSVFERCGFQITAYTADELSALTERHTEEWVVEALKRAAEQGKKSLAYVKAILNNWEKAGAMDSREKPKPKETRRPSYREFEPSSLDKKKAEPMPDALREMIGKTFKTIE